MPSNRRVRAVDEEAFSTKFSSRRDHLDGSDDPLLMRSADSPLDRESPGHTPLTIDLASEHQAAGSGVISDEQDSGDDLPDSGLCPVPLSSSSSAAFTLQRPHRRDRWDSLADELFQVKKRLESVEVKSENLARCLDSTERKTNESEERLSRVEREHQALLRPIHIRRRALQALAEVWRCPLCASIPPVESLMVAECCQQAVGCETCINRLITENDGQPYTCPHCRAENAGVVPIRNVPRSLSAAVKELQNCDEDIH